MNEIRMKEYYRQAVTRMGQFVSTTKQWASAHKVMSAIALVLVLGGGWWAYGKATAASAQTRYVLGTAVQGTVIASVSASGQVSASNQVEVTSKVSGDLLYVSAKSGQEVTSGTLLAQVDAGTAAYELQTAQLSYEKLVTVDPTALRDAQSALTQAEEDVPSAYTSARAALATASTNMNDTLEGLRALFDCNTGYVSSCQLYNQSDTTKQYQQRAQASWDTASALLSDLSKQYRTLSTASTPQEVTAVLAQAYNTAASVAGAAKYTQDAVVYYRAQADTDAEKTKANAAYTSVNSLVSSANATVSNLTSAKNSIVSAERALETAQNNLSDVQQGPDALDVRSSALSVSQKQATLADYYIRAPFDGIIASVGVQFGQNITNGTTIATLITKQKIAELSLNEVDAAKIKVGDKATLTFDAIDGLSLTGAVAEVSGVGTVTQGVVSYTVKIAFDSQDDRVKPGMTVNASIQTDVRQDVLTVPSSAVKTQNGASYVQVFTPALSAIGTQGVVSPTPPVQVAVTVGISDDTNVEILSGLTDGEQIVTRTISGTPTTSAAPAASTRGGLGGAGIKL